MSKIILSFEYNELGDNIK